MGLRASQHASLPNRQDSEKSESFRERKYSRTSRFTERISDPMMCKHLVRRIAENFHLPYFTISPTFSICPIHGYIAGEHHTCPVIIGDGHEVEVVVLEKGEPDRAAAL